MPSTSEDTRSEIIALVRQCLQEKFAPKSFDPGIDDVFELHQKSGDFSITNIIRHCEPTFISAGVAI